jgi:hypothetical protein
MGRRQLATPPAKLERPIVSVPMARRQPRAIARLVLGEPALRREPRHLELGCVAEQDAKRCRRESLFVVCLGVGSLASLDIGQDDGEGAIAARDAEASGSGASRNGCIASATGLANAFTCSGVSGGRRGMDWA